MGDKYVPIINTNSNVVIKYRMVEKVGGWRIKRINNGSVIFYSKQ